MLRQLNKLSLVFILLVSLSPFSVLAAIDTYQFSDAEKQARFQKLTNELRCPKCQNQNIADSNAEIAADLRAKIHLMLEENKSDEAIVNYMLERYGDFVLYQPRLSRQTLLLWTLPAFLLLFGVIAIVWIVRLKRKSSIASLERQDLTDGQRQKLNELFQTHHSNPPH